MTEILPSFIPPSLFRFFPSFFSISSLRERKKRKRVLNVRVWSPFVTDYNLLLSWERMRDQMVKLLFLFLSFSLSHKLPVSIQFKKLSPNYRQQKTPTGKYQRWSSLVQEVSLSHTQQSSDPLEVYIIFFSLSPFSLSLFPSDDLKSPSLSRMSN